MEEEFGWNRSTISLAAAIGFFIHGVSQPFMGRLYDRYGGRKVILASLAVIGLCTLLLSLTFHLAFLILVFGVVLSIAMAGGSLPTTSAFLARWFQRKRATAMRISTAGASLGGLLLVPFAMYLVQATDWRIAWMALGGVVLAALPLAFLLRDDPRDMGLRPDGDPEPPDGSQPRGRPARGPLEVDSWRAAFRSLPLWQLTGAHAICGFTSAMISTHFVPYAQEQGFSPSLAATAFGVMSGLNVGGVIAADTLADRLGRRTLLGLVHLARGCGFALLLLVPGGWGLWSFALIMGFSWWATSPLNVSLTADIYGLKALGTLVGIIFLIHQIAGAASIQLAGILRDVTGSYTLPFAIAGLLLIPSAIAAFSIREKQYSARYQSLAAQPGAASD